MVSGHPMEHSGGAASETHRQHFHGAPNLASSQHEHVALGPDSAIGGASSYTQAVKTGHAGA